jgi:hypothetical protein
MGPCVVVHAHNPSTLEAEAGESRVQGQLGYILRDPVSKTKTTKIPMKTLAQKRYIFF